MTTLQTSLLGHRVAITRDPGPAGGYRWAAVLDTGDDSEILITQVHRGHAATIRSALEGARLAIATEGQS